jgi:hypothetical protein
MHRWRRFVLLLVVAASALGVGVYVHRRSTGSAVRANKATPHVRSAARVEPGLVDPLRPGAKVERDVARAELPADWVRARPGFQTSRTPAQRGGVEPCASQPADTSSFEDWLPVGHGKLSSPKSLAAAASSEFDLVVHLHGDEPVRRTAVAVLAPALG